MRDRKPHPLATLAVWLAMCLFCAAFWIGLARIFLR